MSTALSAPRCSSGVLCVGGGDLRVTVRTRHGWWRVGRSLIFKQLTFRINDKVDRAPSGTSSSTPYCLIPAVDATEMEVNTLIPRNFLVPT